VPHGALLHGPPGTGKTLLARALPGEANVPVFSISARGLAESRAGITASRVRPLFAPAKTAGPAITFLDAQDATGRARDSVPAGTPGRVGADLANLADEAALPAARENHEQVQESDFLDALEKIVLGAERKVMLTPADRRRTAFHEAGHAIVGMLTEGADPVRKISIIPRGLALGVTFSAPDADRFNYTEQELRAKIKVALGGRAAEELVYGDLTTGAESDIQQLTQIARQMVGRWGMSPAIGT